MSKVVGCIVVFGALAAPGSVRAQQKFEVPLRVHGGRMIVPVETPSGMQLDFIVSTNGYAALSEPLAEEFMDEAGLTVGGVSVITDGAQILSAADLTIDGEIFDGIIGSNTLNQYDVLIDAPGSRLVFQSIRRTVEWEGMTMSEPVPLRIYHGTILSLDVKLNGEPYPAMLELGTGSLVVNDRVETEASVVGNTVEHFKIGGTNYSDLSISVENLPLFRRFLPDGGGFVLIGAPVALNCAISISYVHQEMRTCVQ
jgi:hypothetical protein